MPFPTTNLDSVLKNIGWFRLWHYDIWQTNDLSKRKIPYGVEGIDSTENIFGHKSRPFSSSFTFKTLFLIVLDYGE